MTVYGSRVSIACLLLVAVGLLDLFSTILLLELGLAEEANPIMRALIPYGWLAFSAVKCASLLAFVAVLTWYRARHPRLGSAIEVGTLLGYVAVYAGLFSYIN